MDEIREWLEVIPVWLRVIIGLIVVACVYSYARYGSLQPMNYWDFWMRSNRTDKIIDALPTIPHHHLPQI